MMYHTPACRTSRQTHSAPRLDERAQKQSESANTNPPCYWLKLRFFILYQPCCMFLLQDSRSFYGFFAVADVICHTVYCGSVRASLLSSPFCFHLLVLLCKLLGFFSQSLNRMSVLAFTRLSLQRQICS